MIRDEHAGRFLDAKNNGRWELFGPPARCEGPVCADDSRAAWHLPFLPKTTVRFLQTARRSLFPLAVILLAAGCATPVATVREWKRTRCYDGPERAFSDVAVVLVAGLNPVPRINSIDREDVPDRVEYHLLPGSHSIVVGACRGQTTDMPVSCALRAGYVYLLQADIWNLKRKGLRSVEFDWRPRIEELDTFDELTSETYVDLRIMSCKRMSIGGPAPFAFETQTPMDRINTDEMAHFSDSGMSAITEQMMSSFLPFGLSQSRSPALEHPPSYWGIVPEFLEPSENWKRVKPAAKSTD